VNYRFIKKSVINITLREKYQSIAKQMLLMKFDLTKYTFLYIYIYIYIYIYTSEIHLISMKYIFHFCVYKIYGLFARNKILFYHYLNKYLFQ